MCPKFKLYPDNFGLHPGNELAVMLYRLAMRDERVGTFAGAFLLRTLTPEAALSLIESDAFRRYFPTWLHKQQTLHLMMVIDDVATQQRAQKEDLARKAASR